MPAVSHKHHYLIFQKSQHKYQEALTLAREIKVKKNTFLPAFLLETGLVQMQTMCTYSHDHAVRQRGTCYARCTPPHHSVSDKL